ncbi:MAG: hypothetical protein WAQ25_04735 [Candidatus Saccharimonas sp.]
MAFEYPHRIVNLDMDSTFFEFEHPIKLALAERGIAYADPTTDFYIAKRYQDPEVVEMIEGIQHAKGFFQNLPLIDGAKDAWYEMIERGYSPRFCSKPLQKNPYCLEEKRAAIDFHFGAKAVDEAYIGRDKESEPGIALIDDRPGLGNGHTWQRIIYTQPWNQHESGLRLQSWRDPNLFPILAQCAAHYDRLFGQS